MNIKKYQNILLMIFFCCTACVNSTESNLVNSSDSQESRINLTPNYVDDDYLLLKDVTEPKDIALDLPIIPGALAGSVMTKTIFTEKMSIGKSSVINLSLYEEKIKQYATPILATQYTNGLIVIPKETKIARLATFARDLNTGEFLGETGIRDFKAYKQFQTFIVYFDRAANVYGETKEGNMNGTYDIEVEKAGFIWIEVIKLEEQSFLIRNLEKTGNQTLMIKKKVQKKLKT